jgi:FixJ family two-component response regulator
MIAPLETAPFSAETTIQGEVRILDDSPEVLNYLMSVLASSSVACRGFQGIENFFTDGNSPPACVLVDWQLGAVDGLMVAARCREQWPGAAVILISGYATVPVAVTAMRQGVDGVLQKPISPADLLTEIHAAQERSKARLGLAKERIDARAKIQKLRKVELDILKLLAAGAPNKNIALKLSLSVRTIEKYRRLLFDKLGVDSAAEATRIQVLANLEE